MSLLQNSNAIEAGGYPISNSLRFQSASSTYMSRTPASSSNRQIWTWSGWVKRGTIAASTDSPLFSSRPAAGTYTNFQFKSGASVDTLALQDSAGTSLITTQVFRDPSAWYHIVLAVDTTQATSTNRVKMYVNGSQITAFGTATYPTLNANLQINAAQAHSIGIDLFDTTAKFDGYLSEVNFVDGTQLTPSSFGETDATSGQWVAKKYTGTYGTNGFYLPFSNGTSTTTLGADSSGNGNNWTLTNFTRSAGVSDCWMNDVPSGNGSSVGGTQPNSNYCVVNPLSTSYSANISNSNLKFSNVTTGQYPSYGGTIAVNSGKWYYEATPTNAVTLAQTIGFTNNTAQFGFAFQTTLGSVGWGSDGIVYKDNVNVATISGFVVGDVVAVALDLDAGTAQFYKNGVVQSYTVTGLSGNYVPAFNVAYHPSQAMAVNFGQRSFAYTPPSGFKALCTANLPASTIVKGNQYMDATLYTGNGTGQSIINAGGFSPDLVWLKKRGGGVSAQWHMLADTIRGTGATLSSNVTDAEYTGKTSVTAFNSNGFTLGADSTGASYYGWNIASDTYVSWQWDAGSSTVTNTNGTISSQVRANPTAGVSVVTYTGTGGAGTVGHGLGVAPKMIIVKSRSAVTNWAVWHTSIANSQYLWLNSTAAVATDSTYWNSTSPTSSVFSVGGNGNTSDTSAGRTFVAYCFAEIAGFSKFGSYTGNGSADGPFVATNFKPRFVMIKCTSNGTANFTWAIYDSARNEYNVMGQLLQANLSNAEAGAGTAIDFLSNGFKLRAANDGTNAVSQSYIYMAFAESPFANSNSR